MQYLCLIYENEALMADRSPQEMQEIMDEYRAYTQSIIQSGHFKAGDALNPTSTATTVQVRDGKMLTTDGPFAETKEQLGGYYLIEADNIDVAIELASRIPSAKFGSIEVRPVMEFDHQG